MGRNLLPVVAAAGLVSITLGLTYLWIDRHTKPEEGNADPQAQIVKPGHGRRGDGGDVSRVLRNAKAGVKMMMKQCQKAVESLTGKAE